MRIAVLVSLLFWLMASAFAETVSPLSPLDTAKALVSQGKQIEAIPILEKIVASDPASAPKALLMMSDCYDELGKWSEAMECVQKLQTAYPDSVPSREIKLRLMDHYLANGVMDKYRSLRQELTSEFQRDGWRLCYTVGKRRVLRQEYAEAIPELKKAVEVGEGFKNPDVADANYWLLHCYVVQKQWADAEKFGPALIARYPDLAYKLEMEMGQCYQGQGEYDQAIGHLETAAKLAPKGDYYNFRSIHRSLLDCYEKTSALDKAISLGEKLLQDYPGESAWQWRLGWYYLTRKDYGKAAPLFQRAIESSDRQWEIRKSQIYLGQCMFNLGKGDQALEMVETYFKDKPELWDEHLLVKGGVLFYGAKDYEGCIDAEKELLAQAAAGKQSVLVPTARELIFKSLEVMGKLGDAAAVLEDLASESKDPIWLCAAGDDYFKVCNYKEAKRVYKEAIDRTNTPDSIRAKCMYGLALCYWETGLKDAARRLMQETADKYPTTQGGMKARAMLYLWSQPK